MLITAGLDSFFDEKETERVAGTPQVTEKWSEKWSEMGLTERQIEILILMKKNPKISRKELSEKFNINQSAIQRHLNKLKEIGIIKRTGPAKGGYWEIIKE